MSRPYVTRLLLAYFLIVWSAMFIRIDRFPLTWASMYSEFQPHPTVSVRVFDPGRTTQGLRVTHRDGSTGYVSYNDLNISKGHFRKLYYQRMFGQGPAKHSHGNSPMGALNRWLHGLQVGEQRFVAEWDWRILRSLNKTLGHAPSDPKFIVRAEANFEQRRYQRNDLSRSTQIVKHALLTWKDEWQRRWDQER